MVLSGTRADGTLRLYNLSAWQKHRDGQRYYAQARPPAPPRPVVTDFDFLQREHRFLRSEPERAAEGPDDWARRMAMRYEDKLFKEFALCDLTRYRTGQIGLRWRHKAEVLSGKGETICANKNGCLETKGLRTLEVPFSYTEGGVAKACLVKVRVCSACAAKLTYHRDRQHRREARRQEREGPRRKRRRREADRGGRGRAASVDCSSSSDSDSDSHPGSDSPARCSSRSSSSSLSSSSSSVQVALPRDPRPAAPADPPPDAPD
eukprot:EG_transcript_24058